MNAENEQHRALIVEDEPEIAEDLQELLTSLEFNSVIVNNKAEALENLKQGNLCIMLLDLHIYRDPKAAKGHAEHGMSLLREARAMYPARQAHWMPILVVSSNADERDVAVRLMQDGADAVVQKTVRGPRLSEEIRAALDRSGRTSHETCRKKRQPGTTASSPLMLSIPGTRQARRTVVTVGEHAANLPDSSLAVLLHLIIGHVTNTSVHKLTLGTDEQGFKGISRVRENFSGALPAGVDLIKSDHHGNYRLRPDVEIGPCNIAALEDLNQASITALARKLAPLLNG